MGSRLKGKWKKVINIKRRARDPAQTSGEEQMLALRDKVHAATHLLDHGSRDGVIESLIFYERLLGQFWLHSKESPEDDSAVLHPSLLGHPLRCYFRVLALGVFKSNLIESYEDFGIGAC